MKHKLTITALLAAGAFWSMVVAAQDNRIAIPQLPTEYPRMTVGADSPEQIAATSPTCHKKVAT